MKELIGRSRNERKLDGIYNKQRNVLINRIRNKENNDIYLNLSKRKINESLPFPEIYEKKIKVKKSENEDKIDTGINSKGNKNNITIYKGIYMIIYKHIYSKNKFFKSVSVFINLCINYMSNHNKTAFFYAFDKILNVFHENYLYDNLKENNIYAFYNYNELHIKCIISLFDKVINKIIDGKFIINNKYQEDVFSKETYESIIINQKSEQKDLQENKVSSNSNNYNNNNNLSKNLKNDTLLKLNDEKDNSKKNVDLSIQCKDGIKEKVDIVKITKEEKNFLRLLKIKIYYIIILFKLNDNFVFNKLIIIYRQIFEEIKNEHNIYEEKINEKNSEKELNVNLIISKNNLKNEKDDIIFIEKNDELMGEKNVELMGEKNDELMGEKNDEFNNNKMNNEDNISDYLNYFREKWILPNNYEIFKIKKKSFVKCLSNLYYFINISWAKTSVKSLFHDVYLKRKIFDICDEIIIENLQSSIKTNINKKKRKNDSPYLLSIGESLNPVIDARDEQITSIHGSHVWSNKQMER